MLEYIIAQQSNPPDCYQRIAVRLRLHRITSDGTFGLVVVATGDLGRSAPNKGG